MLVIIGGPTASGKSKLAIEVAKRLDGEIVSADSMQIFRGFDIGTAKITTAEMDGIPHYGIDIVEGYETFSVAEYKDYAERVISDIENRGKTPIVVGGTGLYLRSLVQSFSFGGTAAHEDFRIKEREYANTHGNIALHAKLAEIAPDVAANIHPNNVVRVIRALEIATFGQSITDDANKEGRDALYFVLQCDRDVLYDRINQRVDVMIQEGLETEVRSLLDNIPRTVQSFAGIGYKEWLPYFDGKQSIKEVVDAIKINSRHYAKRQVTWFAKENGIPVEYDANIYVMVQKIVDIYENKTNQ